MDHPREIFIHGGHEMTQRKSHTKRTESKTSQVIVEDHEKEDINAQADAFIKNFRNQLRIQRDESFKRYQEMIG
ncbi:hypothetical protein Patl1_29950 [Pistacia atlantica]|uniref:Uncharacterized protein n=1 Tax=Pistacia atlantica TaxID=434234 RepID=A0ACC1ACS4_9ROSI|nr:hypothetical protein Patl1_29950 [Pistacia atlantica]